MKENGKEVSRKLLEEKSIKKPQTKIVAIGSKVMVASASTGKSSSKVVSRNDSARRSGKEFYVTARLIQRIVMVVLELHEQALIYVRIPT